LAQSQYTVPGDPTVYTAQMSVYSAPSGASVYDAGTFKLSWGLDTYGDNTAIPALQQFVRNLLARLIGDAPPLANPGMPYSAGRNTTIQFDGSASVDPDGTIAAYQWDFGDGATSTLAQ